MNTILLFSRDADTLSQVEDYLIRFGYEVHCYDALEDIVDQPLQYRFDVFLADADESINLLRRIVGIWEREAGDSELLLIVDHKLLERSPDIDGHENFDVIERPFSIERVRLHLARTLHARQLRLEAQNLRHERDLIYRPEGFVAASPKTREILELATKVAQSDSTVLLTGETGTGKELVAGAIHYGSARAEGPFVKINCAALPDPLLEAELFGHEKGAFTGADRSRVGRFEQANSGTIFFDEIGDMSLEVQAKVLRVIQEREYQRLGSNRTSKTDVRIVAATNKRLEDEVAEGRFREDLLYRLNVICIEVPPLRERREDILPLVERFSRTLAGDLKKGVKTFSPEAIEALLAHSWPGNIRELRNIVERGVLLSEGRVITREDLQLPADTPSSDMRIGAVEVPGAALKLKEVERQVILEALERSDWVQKDAAALLGVSTRVLNHKIGKFGIKHVGWRRNS